MTHISPFSPEDPRLTAFALGELEGEELAAVEAALRDNPAARAAVEEIRATAAQLESALGAEPMLPPAAAKASLTNPYVKKGKLLTFPQIYYLAGGLAAAVVAVLVAYRQQPIQQMVFKEKASEKKTYIAVALPAMWAESGAKNEASARLDADKLTDESVQDLKRDEVTAATVAPERQLAAADQAKSVNPFAPATVSANLLKESPQVVAQSGAIQSTRAYDRRQAEADDQRAQLAGKDREAGKAKAPAVSGKAGGLVDANSAALSPAPSEPESVVAMEKFQISNAPKQEYMKAGSLRTPRSTTDAAPSPATGRSRDMGAVEVMGPQAGGWAKANTESYAYRNDNDFLGAAQNPLSTFSIDVDTASYANVRRFLAEGQLPPPDAVRIEELVNYFPYHYAAPEAGKAEGLGRSKTAPLQAGAAGAAPFAASMEIASAPWAPTHRLVRIGLKGREVSTAARAGANLVFLIDVSGSMDEPNKLPLVKESLRLLLGRLRADDRVAIVVYAGASGLALPSTPVAKSREILEALDALTPGGSTNGAMGLQLAYDIAKANFVTGGLNRVILCTDGDFNVGVTNEGELTRLIGEKAKSGVFLTVLGFGMGNYKDATLEQLADKGNGNYGYIDSRREAEKLLVEQVSGTLVTIAKDVKIQVEFNPAQVASYRLIGYENRLLKQEDFNNDAVDAGEIGAGHTVTALYEIVPTSQVMGDGSEVMGVPAVEELRYGAVSGQQSAVSLSDQKADSRKQKADSLGSRELLTLKVRYKESEGTISRKLVFPLVDGGARFADASTDFKFAAAVAEFGMILRDSPHKGTGTLADVQAWAEAGTDGDVAGYRSEFAQLVRQAEALLQ